MSHNLLDMQESHCSFETPCPLCGSTAATTVSVTDYDEIWSNLVIEWGASISDAVKMSHMLQPVIKLLSCATCHLEYFSPVIPGSSQFYSELTSSCAQYYTDHKWEFDYIKKNLVKDSHMVLDVACGKAAFLRSIKDSVVSAIGIDTNPDAVSHSNETHLSIFNQSIEDFSLTHSEQFDLVSAFQIIEHLGSVMPFVSSAYKCVKPGGLLVLSVPNRARRKDPGFDPLDYPPHHLSRWTEDQLSLIAAKLDAELVTLAKEPLTKAQTIDALRFKELRELLPSKFPGRDLLIKVISRLALTFPLSLMWNMLKMSKRLRMHGISMIAIIRKPMANGKAHNDAQRSQSW